MLKAIKDLFVDSYLIIISSWTLLSMYTGLVITVITQHTTIGALLSLFSVSLMLTYVLIMTRLYTIKRIMIDGKFWITTGWFVIITASWASALIMLFFMADQLAELPDKGPTSRMIHDTIGAVLMALLTMIAVPWSIMKGDKWDMVDPALLVFKCRQPNALSSLLFIILLTAVVNFVSNIYLLTIPLQLAWVCRFLLLDPPKRKAKVKATKTVESFA